MFIEPKRIIANLALNDGMVVADFGFGNGSYTEELAKQVGVTGKVYAVEIQELLITRAQQHFIELGINNTEFIHGNLEIEKGSKIADKTVDLVLLSSIFFQSEDDRAIIKETMRILKNGGRIVVIDWQDSFAGIGPTPELVFNEEQAIKLFSEFNTEIVRRLENIGKYHYGIIFRKK